MISTRVLNTRTKRITATLALATASIGVLAGCSPAPFSSAPLSTSTPSPASSSSSGKVTTIVNELAGGTTIHQVSAGDIGLTINYYSELNMAKWTASANKPVSLSLKASYNGPKKQRVYLASLTETTQVNGPKGALTAPAPFADQSTVTPGYLIRSPYTYSQTVILPALDPKATSVTLTFTYALLLQAEPGSKTYAKQTAVDTLTVAIAH